MNALMTVGLVLGSAALGAAVTAIFLHRKVDALLAAYSEGRGKHREPEPTNKIEDFLA